MTACNLYQRWTIADDNFLEEHWGSMPTIRIAKKLGRTEGAVTKRAWIIGLRGYAQAGDFLYISTIMEAMTGNSSGSFRETLLRNGLPVWPKKIGNTVRQVIRLDEFWEWAEKHREVIDWARVPPKVFGAEPDWVAQQRMTDHFQGKSSRHQKWTKTDDEILAYMYKKGCTLEEIAQDLGRSPMAVSNRRTRLGLPRTTRKRINRPWPTDHDPVAEGLLAYKSYAVIAAETGRSEASCRQHERILYGASDPDKVRAALKKTEVAK